MKKQILREFKQKKIDFNIRFQIKPKTFLSIVLRNFSPAFFKLILKCFQYSGKLQKYANKEF